MKIIKDVLFSTLVLFMMLVDASCILKNFKFSWKIGTSYGAIEIKRRVIKDNDSSLNGGLIVYTMKSKHTNTARNCLQ